MGFLRFAVCFLVCASVAGVCSARRLGFLGKFDEVNKQLDAYTAKQDAEHELEARLLWFEQKLDHFNPASTETWLQRYAMKTKHYNDNGLIFLFIEGETTIRPTWLKYGAMAEDAKKFGATQVIIEHRFYGGSRPKPDLTLDSLKYLSSEQALADLAYFITKINAQLGYQNPKWVVFGGSYAGSLAAWLRYKYPHLVYAAVSSSGPLLAKVDFPEYLQTVTNSLATAGTKCVEAIKTANRKISDGISNSTKREHYRELFRLCDPLDYNEKDIANLFETLADNFAWVVQYNRNRMNTDSDTMYIDINAVCGIMTDDRIHCPVHRYAEVNKLLLTLSGDECLSHKYSDLVKMLRDTSLHLESSIWRQWLYQTCTEFGFYQTSSSSDDTFGGKFPLKYFIDLCTDVYGPGFDEAFLNRSIDETNMNYGAYSLPVSRVVFIHGSIDPWSPLGITANPPEGSYAILISGTAHCANMLPQTRDDPPQLVKARSKVSEIIGNWLSGKTWKRKQSAFYFS